ncbi:acetyl-CoA carboxylase carboxyl transferase subunit [Streptomyces catenulae]|uniref:Multifunctional fusion protein n=1 Tax=Streptomyces catenulae TaxID=66875 RepID=A0ABV2YZC9_9ACTN|nr:acetyl-CoA carboxylase carboxyl transferase subunit [Streptomyces catenulae]
MRQTAEPRPGQGDDWAVCPRCREMVYGPRLVRNLRVCPGCGHHHRLTAPERIEQLLDEGSTELLPLPVWSGDPLRFTDTEPYPARLAAARLATGLDEAVVLARGTLGGHPVLTAVMDFRFLGGSLGSAVGELITRAAERALDERVPLLIVTASGGARMQEGALSLMQMAKTAQVLGDLDRAGILTLSLITDPTYGGVAASFATLCDVIIAEPGARMGFAGPRVIAQTLRQDLPEGFQTAEHLLEHGLVDTVRPRSELRDSLARLLAAAAPARPDTVPPPDGTALIRDPDQLPEADAWETVRRARHLGRPTTLDYIGRLFTGFEELHGDRAGGECPSIVGGPARLDGVPVMVIGTQKGHTVAELRARNFGMATPAGYRKSARLLRLAGKLGLPVITFVDTPGAYPGVEAEEQGQAVVIAENIRLMAGVPVPVITLVTGEGGSGGALALAVADRVLVCAHSLYSVISPEGCAAILWNDPAMAPQAAEALRIDAGALLRLGIADAVVPEPAQGAHSDPVRAADHVHAALGSVLAELRALPAQVLVSERHARFRAFGAVESFLTATEEAMQS